MAENKIGLKSVKELLDFNFFIPNYQRGYRWEEQQVKDLLNDIWEFSQKDDKRNGEFYCLQPLVIKEMSETDKKANDLNITDTWYEVIDGQQRLTTIYLILTSLKKKVQLYDLIYQRKTTIPSTTAVNDSNIDSFYMRSALKAINDWDIDSFSNTLLGYEPDSKGNDGANNIRFIWYETEEADPIKVFTRLNIGKISLTNAELIKALFLNRSNFCNEKSNHLRLRQQEIASEWDNIEYTLQNDEFWLFLHENGYDKPTRIDFIFDLISEQDSCKLFRKENSKEEIDKEKMKVAIGTDEYKTFRYFYACFEQKNEQMLKKCWDEVKEYFQTFQEWFNDLELYHYVGFLIEYKHSVPELVKIWKEKNTKLEFIIELKKRIKNHINVCKDLNKQYEINGSPKTQCRPLLLLHNIQTIIDQGKDFTTKKEYELPVFYKFPFHLFKKEHWDVEHIDSNSENEMNDKDSRNEFLLNIYHSVNSDFQQKISVFINTTDAANWNDFGEFTKEAKDSLSDEEKNKVWNFTLLDSSTNRSYGNAIFAAKRRIIIGKDRGVSLPIPRIKKKNNQSELSVGEEEKAKTAFIPPCTKNVFMKYYTPVLTNYNYWTKPDAEAYKQNILNTLKDFEVIDSSNNQNEEHNVQQ